MTPPRYLFELAYRGTNYSGWQRQPNALSVEEAIDTILSTVLGEKIKIVGCGRTDRGVHASAYAAHFEYAGELPPSLIGRLNRMLPDDIALNALYRVPDRTHARFSATGRGYTYRVAMAKDPFRPDTITVLPKPELLDHDLMHTAAALLLDFTAFAPFCKTNSDAFTMNCTLTESRWDFGEKEWSYHVSANRFLRGMVRLIVGMCVRVGGGKLSLEEVRRALETQTPLPRPYSVPPEGLFLSRVDYPDRDAWERLG